MRTLQHVDTFIEYYFDAASGALAAVYEGGSNGGGARWCSAGPAAGITLSSSCPPLTSLCARDAGTDGG